MGAITARSNRRSRALGAAAGLIPAGLLTLLFAISGSAAPLPDIAVSLGLVTLIATTAGWIAGPLTLARRSFLMSTIGYAIAFIVASSALSVIQAAADAVAEDGLDLVAVVVAIVGRAAVTTAGIAYLIVPAIVLGSAWSISAQSLSRLSAASHEDRAR
jgi:hypothetical protein